MKLQKICIIIGICILVLVGCNKAIPITRQSDEYYALGTHIKITMNYAGEAEKHFRNIQMLIEDLENKLSKNIATSEISKINLMAGIEPVEVSAETFALVKMGKKYSEISDGRFDITIGALVNLWDIGGDSPKVPTETALMEVIPLTNYKDLILDDQDQTIMLLNKGSIMDLGAIAKGYVADQVANYFTENNIESGIINLGGNVVTIGIKPSKDKWSIGLQDPKQERGKELGIIHCGPLSIVTSGIYERYLEKDGKSYHHLLNPVTGYPYDNELASLTILSEKSVDGDGLSTTVFAMGLEAGYEFVENYPDIEAIFITKDNKVYLTSGAKPLFTLVNESFEIKDF